MISREMQDWLQIFVVPVPKIPKSQVGIGKPGDSGILSVADLLLWYNDHEIVFATSQKNTASRLLYDVDFHLSHVNVADAESVQQCRAVWRPDWKRETQYYEKWKQKELRWRHDLFNCIYKAKRVRFRCLVFLVQWWCVFSIFNLFVHLWRNRTPWIVRYVFDFLNRNSCEIVVLLFRII